MGKFATVLLVLFFVGITTSSWSSSYICCPGGQLILYKRPAVYSCWDPVKDVVTPISLACDNPQHLPQRPGLGLVVDGDGDLQILLKNREITYERDTFCIGRKASRRDPTLSSTMRIAVVCQEETFTYISEENYGYPMIISVVFLLITAGYYMSAPGLRDLLGKSIISFCVNLAIGLGILAGMKLVPYSDMTLCAVRGFLAYFFLMASFFWMNAIAVQIFHTLREGMAERIYGWVDYVKFALYSWGMPTALTVFMALVNFMPGDHLKPGIGLNHCWFFDVKQQWQYMYSVMALLIAVNVGIFIYAAVNIWQDGFPVKIKNKFLLTTQMFVITGIPWVLEMVSSLVKTNNIAWEIVDVIISLQGVMIFLVLVVFRPRDHPSPPPALTHYISNITTDQPYKKMVEEL